MNTAAKAFKGLDKFPFKLISENSTTDFDLYLKTNNKIVLYSHTGYKWRQKEITDLRRQGHSNFYTKESDQWIVNTYSSIYDLTAFPKKLTQPKKLTKIVENSKKLLRFIYNNQITAACMDRARVLANEIVHTLREHPEYIHKILNSTQTDIQFYEGIRVSALSTAIAIRMGISQQASLEHIALGGLCHQIGHRNVFLNPKKRPLTSNRIQRSSMAKHYFNSHQTKAMAKFSHITKQIIRHHRERLDGSGYPDNLDKNSILPEVKIVSVAAIYSRLTTNTSKRKKNSTFDILKWMNTNLVSKKIAKEPYDGLVRALSLPRK